MFFAKGSMPSMKMALGCDRTSLHFEAPFPKNIIVFFSLRSLNEAAVMICVLVLQTVYSERS